ncbi:MAG: penicillin-binding protein 2 [Saprospiraceae bacterium]|nr:penicillin-binding protein 2 [Saprospiraceae bacterium]
MADKEKKNLFLSLRIVIVIIIVILISLLAKFQLFDPFYSVKANATTLIQKNIEPERGLFYDRKGKILVINYPTYDLYVTYKNIKPGFDTVKFCNLLNISKKVFIENLDKDWSSNMYSKSVPFVFLKNIEPETFLRFQENIFQFPAFTPYVRSVREYPRPHGAHFLGYMSEVKKSDIEQSKGEYRLGDYIGVNGLEKQYENYIRGYKGVQFVLRDKLGQEVGSYQNGILDRNAEAGADLILGVDMDLQAYCESLLQNKAGSIVAIEPSTGEILSLASSPNYNPNLLSINRNRGRDYAYLLLDSTKPLFDRSASAVYPPGSIFKPILALVALQEQVLFKNTAHSCNGAYYYKTVSYGCHHHPYPNNVSVALEHSCNSFFIQTFRDLIEKNGFNKPKEGLDILTRYLGHFGLGKPLYSDVATENGGFIPTSEYYSRLYKTNNWRSTYIISVGIGQGELQLTTLQMANLAAIIANKGFYITPHLVKGFNHLNSEIPENIRTKYIIPIDKHHYEPVIEGMENAVKSGTATKAFNYHIPICGKTGTSQNPHGDDHSVFFAFAPRENPKIALAVYIENAGWGGNVAAPIGSLVIEKYLHDTISASRKYLEKNMIDLKINPNKKR